MKRFISMLLAMLMLLALLAGCGSEPDASADAVPGTADEETPAADTPAVSEPDTADDETYGLVTIQYGPYTYENVPYSTVLEGKGSTALPLVTDGTELEIAMMWTSAYVGSPNELYCYQAIEEATGIRIKWNTFAASEQWGLLFASDMLPDMVCTTTSTYPGGVDKAIEDEIYLAGNDYMDIMPNYSALLKCDPSIDKMSKTDTGNYWFPQITTGGEPAWLGALIRGDWLEDLGMEAPKTFDDWHEMLTRFNTEKGASGMCIEPNGGIGRWGHPAGLVVGYDTWGGLIAKNGTDIAFGYTEEGMREYVEMMAQWYQEGLIQIDFVSGLSGQDLYGNGSAGAFDVGMSFDIINFELTNTDEGNYVLPVPYPARTEAEYCNGHLRQYNASANYHGTFITTQAADRGTDEVCARWIDYLYSEQGGYERCFGKEGLTWEYGEDGYPHFTDFVRNNPDTSASQMKAITVDFATGAMYYPWFSQWDLATEKQNSCYEAWSATTGDDMWNVPTHITLTTEEAETYSAYYGDIETYVSETILKWIVGEMPLDDAAWNEYIQNVERMNVAECLEAYQAALDRYNQR